MINKEDFWKLKQSDRIEYRQIERLIDEKYDTNNTISSIHLVVFWFAFILLITICLAVISGKETALIFASKINKPIKIAIVAFLVIGLFLDMLDTIWNNKEMNKLKRRFFKIEPK